MFRSQVPAPRILVDGVPVDGVVTELGHLGGYDLVIATTVGPLALDVQTTVLGHPLSPTAVAHLVRAPGVGDVSSEILEAGGLDGHVARSRRLLEHYAQVHAAVEQLVDGDVRIELADLALEAAARL